MRQLGVIRDKQAFSAAEVARKEYFYCGPSPGMFLFISNDLWTIPWFFAHCEIPNSLILSLLSGNVIHVSFSQDLSAILCCCSFLDIKAEVWYR